MRKLLAIVLSMALCIGLMAGCSSKPAEPTVTQAPTTESTAAPTEAATEAPTEAVPSDPIEALPGSIYYFGYAVEGMDDLIQFYHFYPDDLGIGAVFYAGYAWNQVTFSGTYTVEKADCPYEVYFERDGELQKGTAPYTITLYGWDGAELDKIGYDGEYVYNSAVNVNCDPMTGGGTYRQSKADAAAIEAGAATFSGEKGIPYKSFVDPTDASATLQLNTNGTYSDMVVFAIDGTWAKTGDNEYTLTPQEATDDGAVLTEQEDGTFLYASASGTEVVLNEVKEAAVSFTFTGKTPFMDAEADVVISCMDDGTSTVSISAFGMEVPIDQGTWSADEAFTFTFVFDGAGELVSEYGGETGVQVHYVNEGTVEVVGAAVDCVCGVVLG